MGTTSRGYPYPEGSDYVASGDDAIEALAQAVNADVAAVNAKFGWSTHATFQPADSVQSIPPGGWTVQWTGTSLLAGFEYDSGGALTYTGPQRPFLITTSVAISNGGGGPGSSSVTVNVNHVPIMGSYHDSDASRTATHTIAVPLWLSPGDFITVVAVASPTGDLDTNALRVYPIGPPL